MTGVRGKTFTAQPYLLSPAVSKETSVKTPFNYVVQLLAAPECNPLLAYFGLVTSIEQRQVAFEGTLYDDLLVPRLVVRRSEKNILLLFVASEK